MDGDPTRRRPGMGDSHPPNHSPCCPKIQTHQKFPRSACDSLLVFSLEKKNSCGRKRKVWDFMDMLGSTSRGTGFPVVFTGKLRWEMRGYFCHLLVSRETWLRAGVQERDCDGTFLPISPFCREKNPPTAGQGSLEDCYNLGKGFSRATSICSRVYLVIK